MNESQQTALRQAEFLQKLAALMNEYDVEFGADSEILCPGDQREFITIDACGHWIPWYERLSHFDVDACIRATQETIKHAEALQQ